MKLTSSQSKIWSRLWEYVQENVLWKLPKIRWTDRTQYYWYTQTFYKVTLNVTKVSILLLYLRIFPQKWLRIGSYLVLSLVITYGLLSVFYSSVFQCTPVSKAYQKSIPGHCIDVRKTWQANAGFNIASDLIILVLPMPAIHSLQMARKPKLGLIFLFGLGSLWVYSVDEVEDYFNLCQCSCSKLLASSFTERFNWPRRHVYVSSNANHFLPISLIPVTKIYYR